MSVAVKPNYEQYNNCDHLINHFGYFTVLESALIWCGIPKDEIPKIAKECKPIGDYNSFSQNTFKHPYISCVEPRCRILHEAFNNNLLKMGRDGKAGDYAENIGTISYSRRTIIISDLKEFIRKYHPNDMPKTLFNNIEVSKAQPISNDDYLAIKAKNDALQLENEHLKQRLNKGINLYKQLQQELAHHQSNQPFLKENTESSYLVTIGLLLELLLTPKGIDNKPPFLSQAKIIEAIDEQRIYGQGKRTLDGRFSNANAALKNAKK